MLLSILLSITLIAICVCNSGLLYMVLRNKHDIETFREAILTHNEFLKQANTDFGHQYKSIRALEDATVKADAEILKLREYCKAVNGELAVLCLKVNSGVNNNVCAS